MERNKATLLACVIGNALEWYDFTLYALLATIIANLFFPQYDKHIALINSFGIFAIGYLMRPLGGLLLGHIGDKISRKKALIITILVMGVATTLIGLLPSYQHWGVMSAILLAVLRMIQGLGVGGEYPGSMVLLIEITPQENNVFIASLSFIGAVCGMFLASIVSMLVSHSMSHHAFATWGWRIPFLLGIVLAALGIYIRLKLWRNDMPILYSNTKKPVVLLFTQFFKPLLYTIAIWSFTAVYTGCLMIFLVTYLTHYLHLSMKTALLSETLFTILVALAYLLGAKLVDKLQCYHRWMLIGLFVNVILLYPLFLLMGTNHIVIFMALAVAIIIGAMAQSPAIKVITGSFPKSVRYTGTALSMGFAMSLFAGTAPMLLIWMIEHFGTTAPAFYLILSAIVSMWGVNRTRTN
jgi:predicted MFS family arabinose efflux permease